MMALQHQNFVLGNSITNLVQKWPPPPTQLDQDTTKEALGMFGILLETKDKIFTLAMLLSMYAEQATKQKVKYKT